MTALFITQYRAQPSPRWLQTILPSVSDTLVGTYIALHKQASKQDLKPPRTRLVCINISNFLSDACIFAFSVCIPNLEWRVNGTVWPTIEKNEQTCRTLCSNILIDITKFNQIFSERALWVSYLLTPLNTACSPNSLSFCKVIIAI